MTHSSIAPAESPTQRAWRLPAVWTLLAGAAILWARRPDQIANPQLWAEEGIFFFQARVQGWEAFTLELAGYSQLAPRVLAGIASLVDPAHVPTVFVGGAVLLTLYVMALLLSRRFPLPFRSGCALALVLAPDASEVLLHAGNIQWILALALTALLVYSDPTSRLQSAHDVTAAALIGLSGPFSIILAPLYLWRWLVRRTSASAVLAVVVAACALLQGVSILRHPQQMPTGGTFDIAATAAFPGARVLGGMFLGPWQMSGLPVALSIGLTAATLGCVLVFALQKGKLRLPRLLLGMAFAGLLASTIFRCWHSMPALCVPSSATRYVYPLQVLFFWLLCSRLQAGKRRDQIFFGAVVLWVIATNIPRLQAAPLPDKQWMQYVPQLRRGEEVVVPINPDGWSFPFPARKK